MAPLSPTAPPRLMRLLSSIKIWTAHQSAPSAQLQQETHGLLQMTPRAFRLLIILTVLCGVVFPLIVFGIGQMLFPTQANGSLLTNRHGHVVGSSLIGQQFTNPVYFHGRPSAVGYNEERRSL